MKLRLSTLALSAVLACSAFATAAQTSVGVGVGVDASSGKAAQDGDEVDRLCLQQTGSRIVAQANARGDAADAKAGADASTVKSRKRCTASNGRVYSRDDIDRTGSTDLADALRRLDPSIR